MGYDAGKKVKGRKVHALVDTEGLPLRVVVHSAAIQDRDGAALVFDCIRQRFRSLDSFGADGGYNARQVEHAVAAQPPLRLEIVKRPNDSSGLHRTPAPVGRRTDLLVVRPQPPPGQGLREPCRHPRRLHHTRLSQPRRQAPRQDIDFQSGSYPADITQNTLRIAGRCELLLGVKPRDEQKAAAFP